MRIHSLFRIFSIAVSRHAVIDRFFLTGAWSNFKTGAIMYVGGWE